MKDTEFLKRVLVTGGAGYVGGVLLPKLLAKGHEVCVYDTLYFGSAGVPEHPGVQLIQADLRDIEKFTAAVATMDAVIHLACISNDPSFALNPDLSRSINFDCFEPMVAAAHAAGVKRFIYASSSSVYGVSDAPKVDESHPLLPITDYNKYKGMAEPLLHKYADDNFTTVVIRPATVCGYSPRMRLDLTVNILTNFAVNKGKIKVFGGSQKRPNIHIEDMSNLYVKLLELPSTAISGETFNAGYQNHTVDEIAEIVKKVVEEEFPERAPITIEKTDSDDIRSYHICSEKIANAIGFQPAHSIADAVRDICQAFREDKLPHSFENTNYFNVQKVQELELT